jgi:hypothetical protein
MASRTCLTISGEASRCYGNQPARRTFCSFGGTRAKLRGVMQSTLTLRTLLCEMPA